MANEHNEMLKNYFPLEAIKLLDKIEKSIKVVPMKSISTIPNLLIVGDNNEMNEKYGKCFEEILLLNNIYPVRGNKTYLNLIYPKCGSKLDYERFRQSPKIVSCTQNFFYGVFSISFEEFAGKDLFDNEEFNKLLSFIDDNKTTMNFVFCVTTKFKDFNTLKNILSNHLVIESVSLERINSENGL